jgi:hypothetical protein
MSYGIIKLLGEKIAALRLQRGKGSRMGIGISYTIHKGKKKKKKLERCIYINSGNWRSKR